MMTKKRSAEKSVRDMRRATRRHYSAEEKIRIALEGLRGEDSIAELCRREGIEHRTSRHLQLSYHHPLWQIETLFWRSLNRKRINPLPQVARIVIRLLFICLEFLKYDCSYQSEIT